MISGQVMNRDQCAGTAYILRLVSCVTTYRAHYWQKLRTNLIRDLTPGPVAIVELTMARSTALCLVLALTTVSVSRLACVWECVETQGATHAAAPCHEAPAQVPVLTAAASHCPLTPDEAALWAAKSYEPLRIRLASGTAGAQSPFATSTASSLSRLAAAAPSYTPRPPHRSPTILRI